MDTNAHKTHRGGKYQKTLQWARSICTTQCNASPLDYISSSFRAKKLLKNSMPLQLNKHTANTFCER